MIGSLFPELGLNGPGHKDSASYQRVSTSASGMNAVNVEKREL